MTDCPYRDFAQAYREAGWEGVLPLPPQRKAPVPSGFTGHDGGWPSGAEILRWIEQHPSGNLGLRLPPGVLGLDVDAYGGKTGGVTFLDACRRWGRPPPTWRSTNRPTGQGSILLYRVPEDLAWPGELGPGVEIIQFAHRYLVVAPSIHPEGRPYRWVTPDEVETLIMPELDDLPELPETWVAGLTGGVKLAGRPHAGFTAADVDGWLNKFGGNGMGTCVDMPRALAEYPMAVFLSGGSRHETALHAIHRVVKLGAEGHLGMAAALAELEQRFARSIEGDTSRSPDRGEWRRMVDGAVQLAGAAPVFPHDPCARPALAVPRLPPPESGGVPRLTVVEQRLARFQGVHLNTTTFPPVRYAIDDLIPEGFTLLVGAPKIGKSFLVLEFGLARQSGRQALGRIPVRPGPVLYLALEDGPRRLKDRCRLLQAGAPIPDGITFVIAVDPAELIGTIGEFITAHQGEEPMVILDTLGRAMPPEGRGENTYQRDYRIGVELKTLADRAPGSSLIVNHHDRKASAFDFVEKVSGTNGLAGAADTVVVVARDRGSNEGLLKVTGRDVLEGTYAVKFDGGRWELDGLDLMDASMQATNRRVRSGLTEVQQTILDYLGEYTNIGPADIAEAIGIPANVCRTNLGRLVDKGAVVKTAYGKYALPRPVAVVTPLHPEQQSNNATHATGNTEQPELGNDPDGPEDAG